MLKGKYIGSDKLCYLNKIYIFFISHEPNHYYVSTLKSTNAQFGCFDCNWFYIFEEDYASEPPRTNIELDQDKIYKAKLFGEKQVIVLSCLLTIIYCHRILMLISMKILN